MHPCPPLLTARVSRESQMSWRSPVLFRKKSVSECYLLLSPLLLFLRVGIALNVVAGNLVLKQLLRFIERRWCALNEGVRSLVQAVGSLHHESREKFPAAGLWVAQMINGKFHRTKKSPRVLFCPALFCFLDAFGGGIFGDRTNPC